VKRIAVAVLAIAAGCGRGGGDAVLLRVDGEPITRAELDASVAYLRSYLPPETRDRDVITSALQDDLIPTAAIRAAYKDKIPPLLEKAKAARQRVAAGEDFAAVATAESDDKLTKAHGGDMGVKQRGDLVMPLARVAYSMKDGEVSEPVLTVYGFHVVKRLGVTPGRDHLDDVIHLSQIEFAFGSGLEGRLAWEKVLTDAAGKIQVVDPTMADLVPGKFRPKK
jgi:PPIC-type peptidyl-prolyl cis-trans isomerase-like protein